ncbi:hypothetical protein IEQ34_013625 [Dendrobium chrysotoxum]|uniref:Glycosyltransferase 61 catalytic domain-containing protein n=1 Tax=Dendrobium chrysotoxum TaxID=161865 RepID=A0AAV7G9D7_DENCH|nr:hypothetical protein IEQ34_013625 [Dendrobium chrysotoxum]
MKPVCDFSGKRSDICELKGNIRIQGNSSLILSEISTSQREQSWTIKPHPRKGDLTALQHVTEMSVKLSSNKEEIPSCSINHTIPAIFFSAGGYMGNIFHDFTDILIPLFITSTSFRTEVQFLISNVQPWWLAKYRPYLQQLSKYEVINFNKIENVHCYPHVIVGLRKHKEMSIDPSRAPNSYSMVDFSQIMKKSYGLERQESIKLGDNQAKKPRLLIIARKFTRSFMNIDEIVRMAEDLGYEAVVAEADVSSNLVRFSHIVNSCDVIMGVHGAGLTNLVFLPINSVVIQIVPLGGLENIAWIDFGRPAFEMKLRYLQYVISEEESSLIEQFDRDGPVFKDPGSIQRQGWLALRKIYLDHQNVRLDVNRFKSHIIQFSNADTAEEEPIINPEKWKSMCDYSNRRSDVCELTGDVRIPINQRSVLLVAKSQSNDSHKIRPYARKSDPSAMSNVAQFTLTLSQNHNSPVCTHNHSSPAIVFSVGGYAGNYFHDFSDILLPLFQTSHTFHGKVHFLVSNFRWWWVNKYLTIFQGLSQYEILNFNEAGNNNSAIHCFPKAIIGLHSNNDLMLKTGDSMVQFTEFLRRAYLLERNEPIKAEELSVKKPRLLIIARSHTRRFVNLEKIVKMGEKLGFEVLVAEAEANVVRFARVVNTCDVMMGVHGAGLTNLVFLPTNAVFIQVVPWGKLDWISNTYFKEPAISMKLKYLQYDIKEEESTLMEIYGRDDPVFRDPYSIHKLGWERMKAIYLEKQNVKLNVRRFRGVLVEAMKLLRQR